MSAAAPPAGATQQPPGVAPSEPCPLCGTPLAPDQEWCLRCGAAARTRLAATPNWRAPLIAVAVTIALALGVLVAALVKLAGDTGPTPAASTRTVTTTGSTPGAPAITTPATSVPTGTTAGTPTSGATTTTTGGAATTTGTNATTQQQTGKAGSPANAGGTAAP